MEVICCACLLVRRWSFLATPRSGLHGPCMVSLWERVQMLGSMAACMEGEPSTRK